MIGAVSIAIGIVVALGLIEYGISQIGGYIMKSCFIVGFVSLFVNVILMSKSE